LGVPVIRPQIIETTALGAAYLAGLTAGVWSSLSELAAQWQVERIFEPLISRAMAADKLYEWQRAVQRVRETDATAS
jgi:glycerol kinase